MKGCFGNNVVLNFQISQGSVAIQLRSGRNLYHSYIATQIVSLESADERILKIGHYP